jgi:hypothetical protein
MLDALLVTPWFGGGVLGGVSTVSVFGVLGNERESRGGVAEVGQLVAGVE